MIGRKHHVTQQFELNLKRVESGAKGGSSFYEMLACKPLGEVDKNKINFNLNFTSFIRSTSIGSLELETPTKEEDDSGKEYC
jgi:hypothetical protein